MSERTKRDDDPVPELPAKSKGGAAALQAEYDKLKVEIERSTIGRTGYDDETMEKIRRRDEIVRQLDAARDRGK